MKRRSERVRLKRLSEIEAVGEAANTSPIQDNALSVSSLDRKLLPVLVEKQNQETSVKVEKPKLRTNLALTFLAFCLGIIGLGINGWYSYSRGTTEIDRYLFLGLGLILESILFFLPSQISGHWKSRNFGGFILGCLVYPFLLVFALSNALGFASLNFQETATARAETITPEVSDAQRRLDTLTASRAVECLKRGDRCRSLEKEEQSALDALKEARDKVSETADPQVTSAAKLVSWISLDRYHPAAGDFAMLRLMLLTLLPQLGGLVLMLAQRS